MSLVFYDTSPHQLSSIIDAVVHSQTVGVSDSQYEATQSIYKSALVNAAENFKSFQAHTAAPKSKFVSDQAMSLFRNADNRLAAILISHHRKQKRFGCVQSAEKATAMSNMMLELSAQKEKIQRREQPKDNGQIRVTYKFGPVRYAQQLLLLWIISAKIRPFENDFALQGAGGIHQAAQLIADAAYAGFEYWAIADIASAFPSTTQAHLKQVIRLPERLVRYVAFPLLPTSVQQLGSNTEAPGSLQRELPHGGVHSSFVFSCIVDGAFTAFSEATMRLSYSDNLAVGARTIKEAECALKKLRQRFLHFNAGGYSLHDQEIRYAIAHGGNGVVKDQVYYGNAVNFCGYRVSVDAITGEKRIRPVEKSYRRLYRRIKQVHGFWANLPDECANSAALKLHSEWARSFPRWNRTDLSDELFLQRFEQMRGNYVLGTSV